jgi:serine/threonine-protein kinase
VIHRDLKPANVMLGDFGEVYVLDWGLARLVGSVEPAEPAAAPAERLSAPGDMMGTPLYMAPEQMGDPDVGATADVWSLGAILFEILTLQKARDPRALFAPVDARPSERAPELRIAPELEMICVKATEHDPGDRYPSPRALHDALVRYLEGDRELERRRELSGQYAAEASAALDRADAAESDVTAEQERTTAIRKLRHALALDPNNIDNIKVLGTLIQTPPKKLPREVRDEIVAQEKQLVATGARYSIFASLAWFAFLPFVLWIGIRAGHVYQVALILGPAALAALLSAYGRYRDEFPRGLQLCVISFTILGGAASTTMFGPLMLVPTLLATFTIVIQAHPNRFMRGATWAFGCIALIVVSLIELVWPSSYLQAGEGLLIVPNLHHLPRGASMLLLLSTSLGMTIVPCLFIGRIRQALNDAQRQILVQAWQFRRFGEDLITTQTRP